MHFAGGQRYGSVSSNAGHRSTHGRSHVERSCPRTVKAMSPGLKNVRIRFALFRLVQEVGLRNDADDLSGWIDNLQPAHPLCSRRPTASLNVISGEAVTTRRVITSLTVIMGRSLQFQVELAWVGVPPWRRTIGPHSPPHALSLGRDQGLSLRGAVGPLTRGPKAHRGHSHRAVH